MMKPKIGLALGGGGARGLAHVGMLQVFEEEKIPISCIAGTSMGAIIGAMYAQNPDAQDIERKLRRFLEGKEFEKLRLNVIRESSVSGDQRLSFFRRLAKFFIKEFMFNAILFRQSLISGEKVMNVLKPLLGESDLAQMRIPFAAVAADLTSGEEVVLDDGPVAKAVLASSSIVGILPPVSWHDKLLVDGGLLALVPVSVVRKMGAQIVIAADVGADICHPPVIGDGLEEMLRAFGIMSHKLKQMSIQGADIVIRPQVSNIHWTDFDKVHECIREGRRATLQRINEVRRMMRYGGIYRILSKLRRPMGSQ